MFSNSDSCITFLPRENQYIKMPSKSSRRELLTAMMTGILELPAGWLADLLEGKKNDVQNWSVSASEHMGAACWELQAETPEFVLKMMLSREEPHTPLLYSMDLKEAALSKYRVPPGVSLAITMEFANWQLWYVLPETTFQFTAPSGATEIKPGPEMSGAPLREGAPAPDFSLEKLGGGTVQLKDYLSKNIIIPISGPHGAVPAVESFPWFTKWRKCLLTGVILFTVNQREAPGKITGFLSPKNFQYRCCWTVRARRECCTRLPAFPKSSSSAKTD